MEETITDLANYARRQVLLKRKNEDTGTLIEDKNELSSVRLSPDYYGTSQFESLSLNVFKSMKAIL